MNYEDRVESNPGVMLGKPVIKGTRITVELILRKVADGFSFEEILQMYSHLTKEDLLAAVEYAAEVISKEEMIG
ncbi:MAG TPA: DUF433 domain-containing protein [Chitinophagales bacterium]|nr:DUF433 domain-containing protein [Chitinophagales bacterium]